MSEKAKEVFISYSTKDTEIAFALLEVLESYGLDCWIAPRNIPQGAQWAEEIDKAIQNARVFVVIVSSHSVESRQVPKEVALAVSACESIFPFRIDDIGLQGTFRYYLSDYQFTDATSDTKQKMKELAETICTSLGKPIPKKEPEEKPAPAPKIESEKKTVPEEKPAPISERASQMPPHTKSNKPVLIGIIAAAAVIAVILGVLLSGKGKKDDTAANSDVPAAQESTPAEDTAAEAGSAESAPESAPVQNRSAGTFGVWKMIAYEDRGAKTDVSIDNLFILEDGTPYYSLKDGLSGSQENALTSYMQIKNSSEYDLTADPSFEDTFDGSISAKPDVNRPTLDPIEIVVGTPFGDENPTGLTYEDCYPDRFYFVHLTGTFQESPMKKSDVDTWLVYEKQYPVLNKQILPALAGKWRDGMGNLWEFSENGENLAFQMTDAEGNTYEGVEYKHLAADPEQTNFFEHICFKFTDFDTGYYAVLSFDGRKLEMLDTDWNSVVLTREQ